MYCAYCYKNKILTKEHVIPKSIGGTYTIRVCRECNQERGDSFTYLPFIQWVSTHWDQFIEAINQTTKNEKFKQWVSTGMDKFIQTLNISRKEEFIKALNISERRKTLRF